MLSVTLTLSSLCRVSSAFAGPFVLPAQDFTDLWLNISVLMLKCIVSSAICLSIALCFKKIMGKPCCFVTYRAYSLRNLFIHAEVINGGVRDSLIRSMHLKSLGYLVDLKLKTSFSVDFFFSHELYLRYTKKMTADSFLSLGHWVRQNKVFLVSEPPNLSNLVFKCVDLLLHRPTDTIKLIKQGE